MNKRSEADELMLKAVSILGKARSLKVRARLQAIIELKRGAAMMNKSIKLCPDCIQNRLIRLRHLLGITMRSPIKYHKEVKSDFIFLEDHLNELELDDKANLLSAKGEYKIFLGEKYEGLKFLKEGAEISPNTSMGIYSQTLYDRLLED